MIQMKDVLKTYRNGELEFVALKHINLNIEKGEFLAIMGPSGSGKSTLLQHIGGLDRPTSGQIVVSNIPITELNEKELTLFRRRKLGFVFQNYQLLPMMTVEENVSFSLAADRVPNSTIKERVNELLHSVGLSTKAKSYPSQLSGGQQQRVAIARALAMNPQVLLADEPTGNLDRKRGHDVLQFLSSLHKEQQLTIIMVTHDPFAASFADRVIILQDGEIKEEIQNREGEKDALMAHYLEKLNT